MRKKSWLFLVVFMLSMLFFLPAKDQKKDLREFKVYQSMSFVGGGYDRTLLRVIVSLESYDMEEMFIKIKEFHDNMNGESDELTIYLYNSKLDLQQSNCVGMKMFRKQ